MTNTEKTKILLEAKNLSFTKEGVEALLERCKRRGNLPDAIEYVSACLAEFSDVEILNKATEVLVELKAKKVAKKRTRGPNKKK